MLALVGGGVPAASLPIDGSGQPVVNLKPLEKTTVNVRTEEEYMTLVRFFELTGWKWDSGDLPTDTYSYDWDNYEEDTCVDAGIDYSIDGRYNGGRFSYDNMSYAEGNGWDILSLQEFFDRQGISSSLVDRVNSWFDSRS